MIRNINKEKFFFIPGVILHIDSDESYMNRCLEYYRSQNLKAYGFLSKESDFEKKIISLIDKYNPSIVVLTGHDAYYAKSKAGNSYKNSNYFINTVKKIKKSYGDRIIIFAGACQSNFEGIIKAGASFASSPKRVNIHALDPAIVASYIALTDVNEIIDIEHVCNKTHYGFKGIGGIKITGKMYTGYPRKENNEYKSNKAEN